MTIARKLYKKTFLIPLAAIFAYTIIGFWIIPWIARDMLVKKLEQALQRPVVIEKIKVNPYTLTIEVTNVEIKNKDSRHFVTFDRLFANAGISSVFMLSLVLNQVTLDNPLINITRHSNGSFSFSDLLHEKSSKTVAATGPQQDLPIRFVFENVHVNGGRLVFEDQGVGKIHRADQISLSVPFISSRPKDLEKSVNLDLFALVNHSKLMIRADCKPFTKEMTSQIKVKASDIDLLEYLPYLALPEGLVCSDLDLSMDAAADYARQVDGHRFSVKGRISLSNADLKTDQKEQLLSFKRFEVFVADADILQGDINISQARLIDPTIHLERDQNGRLNILSYMKGSGQNANDDQTSAKTKPPPSSKEFRLSLKSAEIAQGMIHFEDRSVAREFKTKISPLNLVISDFSIGEKVKGNYKLECTTEINETLTMDGAFTANPLSVNGTAQADQMKIDKYLPYFESFVGFDITSGLASLDTDFSFGGTTDKKNADWSLRLRQLSVDDLEIIDRSDKEKMLNLPVFTVSGASIDSGSRQIKTGKVHTKKGRILLKRLKSGNINFAAGPAESGKQTTSTAQDVEKTGISEKTDGVWLVTLDEFNASGFSMVYKDLTTVDLVKIVLSDISINAQDLKNFDKKAGSLDIGMKFNEFGRVSVKGSVVPALQTVDVSLDLEKIDIKSLQPYFTDAVEILVTSGDLHTSGKINLDLADSKTAMFRFLGEASVTNFVSLDKKNAKDFFKCNSFYLSEADVSAFPLSVAIKDISLTDFYSAIIINDKGRLNISDIFNRDPDMPQKDQQESEKQKGLEHNYNIQVENVTVAAGNISFNDNFTEPNFLADMKDISGSVIGLSSRQDSRAKLHLKGIHGISSPLDIIGLTNLLAPRKAADIEISFKDIELTNFTPYSAKYLGYEIEKGKLILDLDYKIDGNKLSSQNKVRFDNFDLGDKVDSEHATDLPVALAISLLKNSEGQINLDLPVEGELNDPEFEFGTIIFKMLANLIVKVVTSPFAVIGSMFGGGEDLGYTEYDYGQSDLDTANTLKLDTLAKILNEKPDIKLEIQGSYHPLKDRQSLQQAAFEELLKAEKFKHLAAKGETSVDLEHVIVMEEELPVFIDTAYQQAQFPKPRDEQGNEKLLDIEGKKNLLITNMDVGTDELRILAINRSRAVKDYLISNGAVAKERIFLLEPESSQKAYENDKSRITFMLK